MKVGRWWIILGIRFFPVSACAENQLRDEILVSLRQPLFHHYWIWMRGKSDGSRHIIFKSFPFFPPSTSLVSPPYRWWTFLKFIHISMSNHAYTETKSLVWATRFGNSAAVTAEHSLWSLILSCNNSNLLLSLWFLAFVYNCSFCLTFCFHASLNVVPHQCLCNEQPLNYSIMVLYYFNN